MNQSSPNPGASPALYLKNVFAVADLYLPSFLHKLIPSPSDTLRAQGIEIKPISIISGIGGYGFYFESNLIGHAHFGTSKDSSTDRLFIVQITLISDEITTLQHFFTSDGAWARTETNPTSASFTENSKIVFDSSNPILNSIYDILAVEYDKAQEGLADSRRIRTLETFLQKIRIPSPDPAIQHLRSKMMELDLDPVLRWKERFLQFKTLKTERSKIQSVKSRAHHRIRFQGLQNFFLDLVDSSIRLVRRPLNNFLGILDRIFFDPLRWFSKVVRNNMGYSIALGIYSPFTFFFITQPMNPHAMWAVGKVRSAYIESTDQVKSWFSESKQNQLVSFALTASAETQNSNPTQPPMSDSFPLSSDNPDAANQTWDDRMSNFKAMQIAYEESLEIAPRLGRLEQMETQLNWPLIIESTWMSTHHYLDQVQKLLTSKETLTPIAADYLRKEVQKTEQVQLYLWDRNVRFILDHPYTLMDRSKEQTQFDYYIGRAFVLLGEMTETIRKRRTELQLPKEYDSIEKLGREFEKQYQKGDTMMERLKKNSKVFAQKDSYSTPELRSYMKRQWEILYLLQNKTQEASNFGLSLYNWSIRNAVWIIQSIYAMKNDELTSIRPYLFTDRSSAPNGAHGSIDRNDAQLEALFHMLVLEYTSIRKEIGENLKNDVESLQRKQLIQTIQDSLNDRERLLKAEKLL